MAQFDSATVFMLAGVAIIIGYGANILFRKFKAPDILFIMLFGWLVGPAAFGFITSGTSNIVTTMIPFVSSLALAFIMFNGGLELDIPEIGKAGRWAAMLSILGFLLIVAVLTLFFQFVLNLPLLMAILAGVVFGSTSAPTVIPLIMNMTCSTRVKTILTLESAITDVMVVGVGTALVIMLGSPGSSASGAFATLAISVALAAALGFGMGIIWLYSTTILRRYRFYYILTLAVILMIYSTCEIIAPAGGGVIAVLVFGLLLSNAHNIPALPHLDLGKVGIDDKFKILNEETSFFVKVFFFTFLGLYVSTLTFSQNLLLYGAIVIVALFLLRQLVVELLRRADHWKRSDILALRFMFPKGLCTVVVALLPFTKGVSQGITEQTLLGMVALVVIGTTILTSMGAWAVERQLLREGESGKIMEPCDDRSGPEDDTWEG